MSEQHLNKHSDNEGSIEHDSDSSISSDEEATHSAAGIDSGSNTLILLDIQKTLRRLTKRIDDPGKGLFHKVGSVEQHADDNSLRIRELELENERLKHNQSIMIGIMQRQSNEIAFLKSKTEDLTARSMAQNIVIHNYDDYEMGENERDFKPVVLGFLREKMQISPDPREVFVAHKLSPNSNAIVARVDYALKNDIFENIGRLSGLKNSEDKSVYITDQQPEGIRARRMDAKSVAEELKESNKHLPPNQQPKIEVKRDKVYVNKEWQRNPVPPPEPSDILNVDSEEQEKIDKIKFTETSVQGEKGSSFRGVGAKVTSRAEIRRCYKKIRQQFPAATHIMCAYSFKKGGDKVETGKQDDGEWGGAHRILETIRFKKVSNTVIFVVREFGGQEIGANRFKHIKDCSEKVLNKMAG